MGKEKIIARQYTDDNIELYVAKIMEKELAEEGEFDAFDSGYAYIDNHTPILFLKPSILKAFFRGESDITDILFVVKSLFNVDAYKIKILSPYHFDPSLDMEFEEGEEDGWLEAEKRVTDRGHWLTFEMDINLNEEALNIDIFLHDPFGCGKLPEVEKRKLEDAVGEYFGDPFSIIVNNHESSFKVCRQHDATSCGVITAEEIIKRMQGQDLSEEYKPKALVLRVSQIEKLKLYVGELDPRFKHFRECTYTLDKSYIPKVVDKTSHKPTKSSSSKASPEKCDVYTKEMINVSKIKSNQDELRKLLVKLNKDLGIEICEIRGIHGENLLNWAVYHKNLPLVLLLVEEYNFDLCLQDTGRKRTPLCYAGEILTTKYKTLSDKEIDDLLDIIIALLPKYDFTPASLKDKNGKSFCGYFAQIEHLGDRLADSRKQEKLNIIRTRLKHSEELMKKSSLETELGSITAALGGLVLEDDKLEDDPTKYYSLFKTSSGMTAYTDLVSDMLADQIGEEDSDLDDNLDRSKEYNVSPVKERSKECKDLERELKEKTSEKLTSIIADKEYPKRAKGETKKAFDSRLKKYQDTAITEDKSIQKIKQVLEGAKGVSVDADTSEIRTKRIQLFRGKCLNSKPLGIKERTKKETKEYITKKYQGKRLYSDGGFTVKEVSATYERARAGTREYFRQIKAGEKNTALFNAGVAYNKAVGELMAATKLKGNPVVATSKLPEVASEYIAGHMGGAAGGGRDVAYGYKKDKKPYNRCLGNGFAISIVVEDYIKLREQNDLIDVNVDVGKGLTANKVIEEVSFAMEIPERMLRGSLPMVLPRFDRPYEEMSFLKRSQYKRVFGLDEKNYKILQGAFLEDKAPLGKIIEHLIVRHGFLLREITVKGDRKDGYVGTFIVTKNELFHSNYLGEVGKAERLSTRIARKGKLDRVAELGSVSSEASFVSRISKTSSDSKSLG